MRMKAARDDRRTTGGMVSAALAMALVVSVVITVGAAFSRSQRKSEHELARIGLEDVARRVERETRNLRSVMEMSDSVALSRVRTLARLIAENPTILSPSRRAEFNGYAKMLGVDEMHVSDERGVLTRSFPALYEGRSMASSKQSAAFMPAITNRDFALVQEMQGKGLEVGDKSLDGMVFQYAGVARIDQPGIVQIGYRSERIEEAMRLSDVDAIAATARVGRRGKVRVTKSAGLAEIDGTGLRHEIDAKLGRVAVFECDAAGYRIAVTMPESGSKLADDDIFSSLVVLDVILLLLCLAALPTLRRLLANDFRALQSQLSVRIDRSVSLVRLVFGPLTIAAAVVFVVIVASFAFFAVRQARSDAEDTLRAAAADIVNELDTCMDYQLAFIGRELALKYGSAEAMKSLDLKAMMETYFVDEINIVNADGLCINSTVPEICGQDQRSLANPARFCEALIDHGDIVFSQPFRNSATEPNVYRKYVGVAFPKPAKGFVQIGFERAKLREAIDYRLRDMAHAWHIGETGFYVISKTSNGEILSTQDERHDGNTLAGVGFDVFTARMKQNVDERHPESREFLGFREVRFFASEFAGEKCLCTSGVVNQFHRYIAAIPFAEVYGEVVTNVTLVALLLLAIMVTTVLFVSRLSNLVASLKGYIEKEKVNRERDFSIARTIQLSSLPVVFPNEEKFSIYAKMNTAKEVGGDFFDFYRTPSGKMLFLIADVSGKGVPAAMFMMKARAIIKACVFETGDFAAAICEANNRLSANNDAQMFVTAWFGLLDEDAGEVEFVNAGHNPPLVRTLDGSVRWERTRSGPALAAVEGASYRIGRLKLARGESIFAYTDGVTEALDGKGEFYGERRLERTLAECDSAALIESVVDSLDRFVDGAEQADDITMLMLTRK